MSMTKRTVKSVIVEYVNGDVETFQTEHDAYHVVRQNYHKGAKQPHEGWQQHEIRWTEPESQTPKEEPDGQPAT